ncbi:hypothetical protein Aab01nite_82540 [Paractinoplanes abujensis]|uniref:Uncharacterized protein n=1 Tax=Paractinoplanes abujensis TaxID=882441 RepID=A0A7W7CMN3_9ACTN|nr:hypothetical protein [Actinoplanes abujensis]MBB4689930.1 hypothetical protein [Actinoplanes abujensis]GID24664.1 hypothetical protein Aab01nite_82540 [Actinoplanes abujensis]
MTESEEVILVGGPHDGDVIDGVDRALVELEIDGLVHRYIRTAATRESGGQTWTVYNYDGSVRPVMASDAHTKQEHQDTPDSSARTGGVPGPAADADADPSRNIAAPDQRTP